VASAGAQELPARFVGRERPASRSLVLFRRQACWVIPLDSRRIAAAGLSIYRPKSLSETVAWHGARWAMPPLAMRRRGRAGVGLRGELAAALGRSLGRPDLRFAVAAPQPDRATVAAIAPSGTVVAFGKLAASEPAAVRVRREHDALRMVRPLLTQGVVDAPEVLFRGAVDGVEVLLLSPVGRRPQADPRRLRRGHVRALASFVRQAGERPLGSLLPPRVPVDDGWADLVSVASERLARWEDAPVRTALVHGDFAPWNVVGHRSGVAAYDWEDATQEGAPFWDLWHFAVQGAALLGRSGEQSLVDAAVRMQGSLGRAVRSYARGAWLPADLAAPVLVAYLAASGAVVGRHGGLNRPDRLRGLRYRAGVLARLLEAWR
jgi:hypothetical protein